MANTSKRPKKTGFKDEAIDIDELAGMSNMRGMLSFLDTRPEDYAKLFSDAATLPQPVDLIDHDSKHPVSNLPPDRNLQPDSNLPPGSSLESGSSLRPDGNLPPGGKLQPESNLLPDGTLHTDSILLPGSDLLSPHTLPTDSIPLPESDPLPASNSLPDSNLHSDSDLPSGTGLTQPPDRSLSGSRLVSGRDLRTPNGRVIRIRPARSVQDGHTVGEHLLLQCLWKKGSAETENTRLVKAGLRDLAFWTGAHKTRCRDHLRSLVAKLALEEVKTFDAARAEARTYRVFSFSAILDRRRRAGLTHVIRTGAVSFVDSVTGQKLDPGGSESGNRLLPDGILPTGSKLLPDSSLPTGAGSSLSAAPSSSLHPLSKNSPQVEQTTSAAVLRALLQINCFADDEVARRIMTDCRAVRPDLREDEFVELIQTHGSRYNLTKAVMNPIAMLITQLPKYCGGQAFELWRREREAPYNDLLSDPSASDEERQMAREFLGLKGVP